MIKYLFKDIAKYFPAQVVPVIVSFIIIPIVTRLFSPEEYGDYVLVMATVVIFSTIAGWLSMSIIRFYPAHERDRKLAEFYGNIIKLTIISITAISFAFIVFLLFSKPHTSVKLYSFMWIGLVVFILTSIFDVFQHFLRAKRQVSWYSGFTIWKSVMTLVFGILLIIVFHFGIDGLLWGCVLSLAVILPFLFKKAVGRIPFWTKGISISIASKMGKYGFPLVVGNLAAWILSLSDRYMLKFFHSSHELGVYSASYAISERSIFLITSLFILSSGPIGINIWEKEGEEKSREFLQELTRYYLIFCLPAVVGISALAKPVVSVIITQDYYEGYKIFPFVTFGVFFLGLQWIFAFGLRYHKKVAIISYSIFISGLLNLILNFILIPRYGYMAAAVTTLISYCFLLILMIIASRKFLVWEFPIESLRRIMFSSLLMGGLVYYIGRDFTNSAGLNLTFGMFFGAIFYFMMLLLLGEFKNKSIRTLIYFFKGE